MAVLRTAISILNRCRGVAPERRAATKRRRARAAGGSAATGWRWWAGCGALRKRRCATSRSGWRDTGNSTHDRARDARTLAVLVKTMRELLALDKHQGRRGAAGSSEHDDAGPRDLDEFRRELARRMDAIVAVEQKTFLAARNDKSPRWLHDWLQFAHVHQRPPSVAQGGGAWTTWLLIGGRGAGKTRAGAEWVRAQRSAKPYAEAAASR